jgi:hypothetical protein
MANVVKLLLLFVYIAGLNYAVWFFLFFSNGTCRSIPVGQRFVDKSGMFDVPCVVVASLDIGICCSPSYFID